MSTPMTIKSSERGVIRVFHIDLPRDAVDRFTHQAGTGEWPVQYALGAKSLRESFVEVVDIRDLGEMTLSQYLAQAHDVSGADFEAMRAQLDALKGHVLILPSQAFDQTEQELNISAPLRWIGTFNEPSPSPRGAPVRSEAAKGIGGGAKAPEQKQGSALWILVLGLLFLLVIGILVARFVVN
ncbi:aspartate carbamoyltransferase catalytic subunit [Marivita sp. GX14005]|uniref:aspartate carbamoyltransferase catalytic subunit n=1 Tax=Marivita sp. GX14005 TaxID=2942276 RepID=UPI00201A0C2D|nr:aspartate carbamoyltransferase catalytic subunit [Marivita sp. GX14005]MCL3881498.1 aspartate carbamoyltransferase catalytic subunit [Marivita sp. GX14005]